MMNDEFVSHNSNGGWDMLNKWVSMLKKKGGVRLTPRKNWGGLFCVLN